MTNQSDNHPLNRIREHCEARDRTMTDTAFRYFCIATAFVSILILAILLISILYQGVGRLSWQFLSHYPEPDPTKAGLRPALWGTIWVCLTCAALALPIGVATAVLLEEFPPHNRFLRSLHSFVQLNINNLAGVPSVVYGILGLTVFVSMAGKFGSPERPAFEIGVKHYYQVFTAGERAIRIPADASSPEKLELTAGLQGYDVDGNLVDLKIVDSRRELKSLPDSEKEFAALGGKMVTKELEDYWYHLKLPFGRGVIAGAMTLMLVILPVVIISSQEAIRSVPSSLREAGLGLGSTRWQVVRTITLPAAIPGIMTGAILAMSRAIGEAAPLLIIAGVVFITSAPQNLFDNFTVLPLQIYNWAGRPQSEFHEVAAAGIIVLLAILFLFNAAAVLIRQLSSKELS